MAKPEVSIHPRPHTLTWTHNLSGKLLYGTKTKKMSNRFWNAALSLPNKTHEYRNYTGVFRCETTN